MIKSFRHAGLEAFFTKGSKAGIRPEHAKKLAFQLDVLSDVNEPKGMNLLPGWDLHELRGDRAGMWAVKVSSSWRLTFVFDGEGFVDVNYEDYHA